MMSRECEYCATRLRALLDAELGSEEVARVRGHLARCEACQAAAAAAAEVSRLVAALPAAWEPPPHFGADLQIRLGRRRRGCRGLARVARRPRWSRRYSLAAVTIAGAALALFLGAPPRIGAQELVGKVQQSWMQLTSYSCRFVTEGVVRGHPRRFEQRQWFCKPDLFRLETSMHYPEKVYLEADQVTTFIPGAHWYGKSVAITRPRRAREEGLPFPFGAEWPASYDVTMDALVSKLRAQQDGVLLGTEEVLGKRCYGLKFTAQRPGDRLPTHYVVWVDEGSFLPLKVKTYYDTLNQTVSTAVDLRANGMVPADTFRYQPSADTFHVYGEVEPFVFALGMHWPRPRSFEADPIRAARGEMRQRSASVPFSLLAPSHLPEGYSLVRVRAARGRWLDAYWLDNRTGAVIRLVEQRVGTEPPAQTEEGAEISLDNTFGGRGRWHEVRRPAMIQYLTWDQAGTRLELAAAGIDRSEAVRIAASMTTVSDEPRGE